MATHKDKPVSGEDKALAAEGSESPPAATSAVRLEPLPRPDAYYADALKNVLDVFPASGMPVAAAVVAQSFPPPFLRQQVNQQGSRTSTHDNVAYQVDCACGSLAR